MKQLRCLLIAVLLVVMVVPAFGISTTPKFYATKTSDSPSGAGMIYGYRGGGDYANGANGQNDRLTLPAAGDWKSADNTMTVFSGTIKMQEGSPTGNQEPDGYKVMDKKNSGGTQTQMVLHMYFFAKPNPGYQFDGWFSNADGTGALTGSRDHYPMPGVTSGVARVNKNDKVATFSPSTWDNGEGLTTASGYYAAGGFYYLRNPYTFHDFGDGVTVYAKFSVIPRTFTLAATGHAAVTYTATGYSGSISTSNVTTSALSSKISLNLSNPDQEQYIFEGWYWSDGKDGAQTLISESASATFSWTGNSDIVAKMNTVWIWPKVTKVVNSVADVTYNDVTTPYESWNAALTAAKAVSGATITLNQSVSDLSAVQTINKSMTIDLNGNTLTGSANNFFTITGSGVDVTITDNSPQGAGRIELINSTDATTYTVTVRSGAKLTVAGGTIYNKNENASGTARGVEAQSGTTLSVTGGHIEAQSLQNAYALINRGTATISGGDMYAHTTSKATAVAFYNVGTSATVNNGTFRATAATTTAYGIHQNVGNTITINNATVNVSAATSTAYALARSAGVIVVNGGKYKASAPATVAAANVTSNAQISLRGGVYDIHNNLAACAASGYGRYDLVYTDPDYADGYRYVIMSESAEPYVCKVLTTLDVLYYKTLEEAFAYVSSNSSQDLTIVITAAKCALSAGTYTLPGSATLLVPYDVGGTLKTTDPEHPYTAPVTPSVYCKLTLEAGAHIVVNGAVSVSSTSQGGQPYGGCVNGAYGQIDMKTGSTMTFKNGSNLYCWGYITGDGDITAESGSTVYEDFQIACWRGGTAASSMNGNNKKVFPLAQYYIQNIEAKLHLQSGATEKVWTAVSALSDTQRPDNPLPLVGKSSGLFQISSGELTKWYDPENDRQMYQLDGNMALGSISMTVYVTISSTDYVLPLTNNMDITINSGTMTCNNDIALLPGANIKINNGATVSLGSSCRLYVYDRDEWGVFNYYTSVHKGAGYLCEANYSPTCSGIHGKRMYSNMEDAKIDVNGTIEVSKAIYTTSSGANICSSEGSGKVVFNAKAGTETETYQATQSSSDISYTSIRITSAKLLNADGSYTSTSDAVANTTYGYCDGTWTKGGCINYYTITWKSEDGNTTLETDANVAEGSATSFDGTAPTKTATAQYTFTFDGWATEANGAKVYNINGTPVASGNTSYFAHFTQAPVPYTLSWVTDGDALTGNYTSGSTNYGAAITAPNTPTKTGYTFAGWHNGTSVITPATTMPAAAVTYTATWTPNTNTAYTVKHYQQNVDGTYPSTPTETQNLTGTTGAEVTPAVKSYTGFTAPSTQTVTILADGSRVVTYYYTRNSYTITWKDGTTTITTTQVKHGARPAYNYQKQQTPQYTFTLTHWADESHNQYALDNLPLATEAAIYTAIYESVERSYTIRFLNDDGTTVLYSTEVTYGGKPEYKGATPQSTLNDGWLRLFTGWSPEVVTVSGRADYTAKYKQVTLLDVQDEQSVPVSATVTTTTVRVTGKLAIESSAKLTTTDLILEGTPSSSGEITGNGGVDVTHAYYDLTKEGGFKAKTWYSVAVPWQVAVPADDKDQNGVYVKEAGGDGTFVQQLLGRSFDLIYYDGELRASEGHSDACWKYVEDDAKAEQIMYPGRAYMIYFLKNIETIRFERKNGADLKTTTLSVVEHDTSNKKNAGWNGIANPSTYHAYINPITMDENTYGGINYGQLYDGDNWTYKAINLSTTPLVVGQPVYVQVKDSKDNVTAYVNKDDAAFPSHLAPRRATANAKPLIQCEVGIAPSEGETTDRVIVRALEDKEDAYVIAQDLMKMGVSTIVPQMWVNRYDDRLCINTVAPTGMKADYPLGISVPYDGSYEIDVLENADANASLYLTYNGRAIWNLGYGPYEVYMQHGTNMQYGLRVVYDAPQLVTGMEEATIENGEQIRKVMIDDKVYIIRNGEMYSITGAKVQ